METHICVSVGLESILILNEKLREFDVIKKQIDRWKVMCVLV